VEATSGICRNYGQIGQRRDGIVNTKFKIDATRALIGQCCNNVRFNQSKCLYVLILCRLYPRSPLQTWLVACLVQWNIGICYNSRVEGCQYWLSVHCLCRQTRSLHVAICMCGQVETSGLRVSFICQGSSFSLRPWFMLSSYLTLITAMPFFLASLPRSQGRSSKCLMQLPNF
jgi:hypothetical protein